MPLSLSRKEINQGTNQQTTGDRYENNIVVTEKGEKLTTAIKKE